MKDVFEQVERQLIGAIRSELASRRARRRTLTLVLAVGAALLLGLSGASALSGQGPIADLLGVDRNDPTLRSVREVRGAPRALVRVRGHDGHLYTFVAFHARQRGGPLRGRSVCFTQTRDDARRIPSLGCTRPSDLAWQLRRDGAFGGPSWGSSQFDSLRLTLSAAGLVPAAVRRVTLTRERGPAAAAVLSGPIAIRLRSETGGPRARAFIAAATYDNDGADWLRAPARRTITVALADGTTRHQTTSEPQFFPMVDSSRPRGERITMTHPGQAASWRSVGYEGEYGTLCNAAGPPGERLIKPTMLQCSGPLAVVNALERYGAALYLSNFNPRRERGKRSVAAFGFARADARALSVVDSRGRRYEARLSRPWTTVVRRRGDLDGVTGHLRERLTRLPHRMPIRSWIASLDVPPEPLDRGLALTVRLADGDVLRIDGR